MLSRLATEQGRSRLATAIGNALHKRGDNLGVEHTDGDVIEKQQWLGADAENVVDTHAHTVDARRVQ